MFVYALSYQTLPSSLCASSFCVALPPLYPYHKVPTSKLEQQSDLPSISHSPSQELAMLDTKA